MSVVGNGWLVGWLVVNAAFSEKYRRMFQIFCMKLETIKVEKSQSQIFENS